MDKIKITDEFLEFMINKRKSTGLETYQVSQLIGRSKTWYYNVEKGKVTLIDEMDYYNILNVLKDENTLRSYFAAKELEGIREPNIDKDIEIINKMLPHVKEVLDENFLLKKQVEDLKRKLKKIKVLIDE